MKVGTPLKREKNLDGFDAIIIGSGIGGLAAAAILAKEGKKILVLEKHYVAGGFTHVFKRPEYEWDVGIHYIGEVHKEFTFLRRLFDYISDGNLQWQEMDAIYDRIIIEDRVYDFETGLENWRNMLYERFPQETEAIDKYISLTQKSSSLGKTFYKERALPKILSKLFGGLMTNKFLELSDKTTKEVLDGLTDNQELKAVLTGQYGDYGLPPSQSSFAMQAVVNKHYWRGGAFPVGGCEEIAKTIAPVIEKAGGKIVTRAGVEEVLIENGKAVGVRLEDDRIVKAPFIISNVGYINTMNQLLSPSVQQEIGFKLSDAPKVSVAHVCLYIGLKESLKDLGVPTMNHWIYPSNDHDAAVEAYQKDKDAPFPVVYISFPSSKDPKWEERYPGKSTIEMITLAPYDWFEKWEDERWKHRGEEYENLKDYFSQRLLKVLYKHIPQLEGKIDYFELSTPLSTKHFVNYEKGEIYGLDHSPDRFRRKELRPKTPIKNLYLTGQDIVTCGIGGALMGGLLTVSAITTDFFLIDKINSRVDKMRKQKAEV